MNGTQWISIIAMAGWLVLALSAFRAHQISARKGVVLALIWGAIFLAAAAVFSQIAA